MGAVVDLVKVLYEPDAVFQRVAEKARFLIPFLALAAAILVISFTLKPFFAAAIQEGLNQAASRLTPEQAARMPSASTQATILVVVSPLNALFILLIGALLLWVTVSLTGGEARFGALLSVLTYAFATYVLYATISSIVLHLRGVESVASMDDMRAQLGLDLLAPNAGRFMGAFLNGVNPFSVWGVWLTGTGIAVTARTSKPAGYVAAGIAYVIGLLMLSAMGLLQQG
jgi:hypothetical protein